MPWEVPPLTTLGTVGHMSPLLKAHLLPVALGGAPKSHTMWTMPLRSHVPMCHGSSLHSCHVGPQPSPGPSLIPLSGQLLCRAPHSISS